MKTTIQQNRLPDLIAILLVLPATFFITTNLLNELGMPAFYQSIEQFIPQQFGFNANMLIVLGPVAALCIIASRVLHLKWEFSNEQLHFGLTVKKKWLPIAIGLFSGLILFALAVYAALENFNHLNG